MILDMMAGWFVTVRTIGGGVSVHICKSVIIKRTKKGNLSFFASAFRMTRGSVHEDMYMT